MWPRSNLEFLPPFLPNSMVMSSHHGLGSGLNRISKFISPNPRQHSMKYVLLEFPFCRFGNSGSLTCP